MPITVSVRSTIRDLSRDIDRDLRSQLPFATAKALTDTAKDVQRELTAEIDRVFDRPTPFTKRAIGVVTAKKATLTARIFVKDIQAQYLGLEIEGGTRRPKGRALVMPGKQIPLNQYGNLPRNKVRQLLARKDVFSGAVRGVPGLYQRTPRGAKLLILWERQAQYRPRLRFYDVARKVIDARITDNFKRAFAQAIATKR